MTRITTNAAMLPGACVLLTLAACGGGDTPAAGAPRPATARVASATAAAPRSPVVRDGKLAGRLLVTPSTAKPGDELQITVKNIGTIAMTYGLAQQVQQRVDGRWRNAAKEIHGTSEPGFRRIAYSGAIGKCCG